MTITLEQASERFWSQVDRKGPDECWLWRGTVRNTGYGTIHQSVFGHERTHIQVAFFLTHGRWPGRATTTCGQRLCANPAHIIDKTEPQYRLPGRAYGTPSVRGEKQWNAGLTNEQVEHARTLRESGMAIVTIMEVMGIPREKYSAVQKALKGLTWRMV